MIQHSFHHGLDFGNTAHTSVKRMTQMYHCAFLFLCVEEGENGTVISESPLPSTVQEEPGMKLAHDSKKSFIC